MKWVRVPTVEAPQIFLSISILPPNESGYAALMHFDETALDELPTRLPVLALRRGVLLPSAVAPFAIGRKKSKKAFNMAEDGLVIVAVQRDPVDDPGPGDFLPYAVLARIIDEQGGRYFKRTAATVVGIEIIAAQINQHGSISRDMAVVRFSIDANPPPACFSFQ